MITAEQAKNMADEYDVVAEALKLVEKDVLRGVSEGRTGLIYTYSGGSMVVVIQSIEKELMELGYKVQFYSDMCTVEWDY